MPNAGCKIQSALCRRRSGFRRLGTGALGFQGVELAHQSAALAGGGVLVDRVLGGNLVETLHGLGQFNLGLFDVAGGQGSMESLDLLLECVFAEAVEGAAFDALPNTFLCR
jgi:hypothetical protein